MQDERANTPSGDLFLSYHREDGEAVLAVRDLLRTRGIDTFLDRDQLIAGIPWPQALEQALAKTRAVAVFIGPKGLGLWQKREMGYALDRQVQEEMAGRPFPVIPILLPGADVGTSFLFLNTWIDLRNNRTDPEAIEALVRSVHGITKPTDQEPREALCPYRGLHAFREEDAAFFHGREAFTQHLFDAVLSRNITAVVGTSGSGKSSVVRAGVIPKLQTRRPPDDTWDIIIFVPGSRPFHHLAASCMPLLHPELGEIDQLAESHKLGDLLASGEIALESVVERILKKSGGTDRLLLFADQFEELFTHTAEPERLRFVGALLQALDRSSALTLVFTVRGSFYDNLISTSRDFSKRMEQAVVNLGTMSRDELQQAVVEPAKRVGLGFEAGLVKRILDDVGTEPGNLPLLEFALTELWNRRRGKLMTHEAYEEIDGVSGAMARRADAIFTSLSPAQQDQAHRLLIRLINMGDQGELARATRKRTLVRDLGSESQETLEVMADARLLVIGRLGPGGEQTAEVAHEALIHHWERLQRWLDEDREFLLWRRRLQTALIEWERTRRDEGTLLRGTPLREAERWRAERGEDLSCEERQFISDSSTQDRRERTARERRRKLIVLSSLGSALVFLFLAAIALMQTLDAFSRELIAKANNQLAKDPELGLILAIEAVNINPSEEAIDILRRALVQSLVRMTIEESDIINTAAFSPNGTRIATGSNDNTVRIWDITGKQPRSSLELHGHCAPVTSVAFNATGALILTASEDTTVRLWDSLTGEIRLTLQGHTESVNKAAFNEDGTRIVSASEDGTTRVWDVQSGRCLHILRQDKSVTNALFIPHADTIITSSLDQTVRIWNSQTGRETDVLRGHQAPLTDVKLSPDGKTLVTASTDNSARVWKRIEGKWALQQVLMGHTDSITSLAFSPDGEQLVTASKDATARVWNTSTWICLSILRGHTDAITHAGFNAEGSRVLTTSRDNTARIWLPADQLSQHALLGHSDSVENIEFSPDGNLIVTAGSDNSGRVWDVATGRTIATLPGHTDSLNTASFSPKGDCIVTASDDNTARIWPVVKHEGTDHPAQLEGVILKGHTDNVRMANFSPDGRFIVTAGNDKTAKVWDATTGQAILTLGHAKEPEPQTAQTLPHRTTILSPQKTLLALIGANTSVQVLQVTTGAKQAELNGHGNTVTDAVFSPDEQRLLTTSLDGTARIWDLSTGGCLHILQAHDGGVSTAAFSPDGNLAVTAGFDQSVGLWQLDSGRLLKRIPLNEPITDLSFLPDGKSVLIILAKSAPLTWNTEGNQVVQQINELNQISANIHHNRIYSARFSPDGMRVVTASADTTACIWATQTGKLLAILKGHKDGVLDARFNPDGSKILTASKDGTAGIWQVQDGRLLHRLQGHADALTGARFSDDGRLVITSSKDYTAKIWDATTGNELATLPGHRAELTSAELSPDGRFALTASRDETALLWQQTANTWKVVARLYGHKLAVIARFAPDGKSVVTASKDGLVRVWRLTFPVPQANGTGSPTHPLVADCEVCDPSFERIYALASERATHTPTRLFRRIRENCLYANHARFRMISILLDITGKHCTWLKEVQPASSPSLPQTPSKEETR